MTQVSRANGWTFDVVANTLSWPGVRDGVAPLPVQSRAALLYFGAGYLESQAAARSVNDKFRKDKLAELRRSNPDAKASDVAKADLPAPDSDEYQAELRVQHEALFDKLLAGYEVGVREGSADPVTDELHKLGAQWLQGFATAKGWYTLPPKRKVAKLDDAYADPKGRYATFGDALEAFIATRAESVHFAMKDSAGKPWPIKTRKGVALADLLLEEAAARAAAKGADKPGLALGGDGEGADF